MRARILMAALALGAAVAACSGGESTAPERLGLGAGDDTTQGPPPPNTTGTAIPMPTDSQPATFPTSVNVSGRVLYAERYDSGSMDTLRFVAVANAAVVLKRNLLVNGAATQQVAGETTTDAQGRWSFPGVPGGYYVAYATPPSASGLVPNHVLIAATQTTVVADVFVWRER